jgi:hypothetical protein
MEPEVRVRLARENGAVAPFWHFRRLPAPVPASEKSEGLHGTNPAKSPIDFSTLKADLAVLSISRNRYVSWAGATCFSPRTGRKSVLKMSKNSKPTRTPTRLDPLARRIVDLKRERAELEEEILQLRAAVQIWAEVYRQTMHTAAGPETFNAEMR